MTAPVYPFGYIIVVLGRSGLFTEQTALAVLPLLSRETTVGRVARLWGVVLAANLAGAAIFAVAGTLFGIVSDVIGPEGLGDHVPVRQISVVDGAGQFVRRGGPGRTSEVRPCRGMRASVAK